MEIGGVSVSKPPKNRIISCRGCAWAIAAMALAILELMARRNWFETFHLQKKNGPPNRMARRVICLFLQFSNFFLQRGNHCGQFVDRVDERVDEQGRFDPLPPIRVDVPTAEHVSTTNSV